MFRFITFLDNTTDLFASYLLISHFSFSYLILPSIARFSFYILSKRFFLNCEGLSDGKVASNTKNEDSLAVHFLYRFMKSLNSISDE